jgi:hypothetical protein
MIQLFGFLGEKKDNLSVFTDKFLSVARINFVFSEVTQIGLHHHVEVV